MEKPYQYDFAISYAKPDLSIAESLAGRLRSSGLSVFFDLFEQELIWGKRLYKFLAEVYEKRAHFCIVLLSKDYRDRIWPQHELQTAFNRAVRQRGEYILPIRLDDTKIDGLPADLAYISTKKLTIDEIAEICVRKFRRIMQTTSDRLHSDSITAIYRDHFEAGTELLNYIANEERELWIVTSTMKEFFDNTMISDRFRELLCRKSSQPEFKTRILMSSPTTAESRARQEMRPQGSLQLEQEFGLRWLREAVPNIEVAQLNVVPAYLAVRLSHYLLHSPGLYTWDIWRGPVFVYRQTQNHRDPFSVIANDIEMLWGDSETIPDYYIESRIFNKM